MALYTSEYLRTLTRQRTHSLRKSLGSLILEETMTKEAAAKAGRLFDIFLSHSYLDKEEVQGIQIELERFGFSVYVDWMVDTQLDRSKETKETAAKLRERMDQSKCLFFAVSPNTASSVWMPWELGYVDGKKNGRAAILPVVREANRPYYGQEYLGIYPYISKEPEANSEQQVLWVNESADTYVSFGKWLKGKNPTMRS